MQRVRGLIAQVQPASASSQRPSVRDIRDLDLESMSKEELVVLLKQLDRYNRAEERFSETEVLQRTHYKVTRCRGLAVVDHLHWSCFAVFLRPPNSMVCMITM